MGQKVNPIGFRIAVDKNWRSRWFADKRAFGDLLDEDCKIRKYIQQKFANSAVAEVRIERYANRVRINIHSARPGVIMGHKGEDIAKVREELSKKTGKEIYVEVTEVRDPDANAQLVAEGIAQQIVRRIALKRAMKRAQKVAMDLGVDGIKIFAAGRINGAEIARSEWMKEGKVPLHTLRANIGYGFAEANTTAGLIGVKVWICKKDDYQPMKSNRGRRAHAPNA
ncbi:MAG: 30S ribosomal protein S3 [Kiritimatiellae bacterium]|nr:30S ribosomal protein S3 [Kiritimatiellia bacterium]NLE41789.1 30S ribosomal protein S3 [Lentisphaerota bacterium]